MGLVLVCPLGDHPAVVTGTVHCLSPADHSVDAPADHVVNPAAGHRVDKVHLIRPDNPSIALAAREIETLLGVDFEVETECEVLYSFSDVNNEDAAREYLRVLARVLGKYENETVFLSLSGGRKNMSALTAAIAPFFTCVKKLYHLIERVEGGGSPALYKARDLEELSPDEYRSRLLPQRDRLNLFEVRCPFPCGSLARYRRDYIARGVLPSVSGIAAVDNFWASVFADQSRETALTVWLSERAAREYAELELDSNLRRQFDVCFQMMSSPAALQAHAHERIKNRNWTLANLKQMYSIGLTENVGRREHGKLLSRIAWAIPPVPTGGPSHAHPYCTPLARTVSFSRPPSPCPI